MDIGADKKNKGFTLVEILVVLLIFSIMLIAISAVFISGIKTQRNSLAMNQLLDQLNYAVEYMGRSVRMAKKAEDSSYTSKDIIYYIPVVIPANSKIGLLNGSGKGNEAECIFYYLNNDRIYKASTVGSIGLPLTSDDIKITKLLFTVSNQAENNDQPKVTILIEAESISGNPIQKAMVQTTVSQRDLNKKY